MASITLTDVVAHTLIDSGVVNNNNASLRAAINGGLDNANISPSAGIAPTKLQLPGGVVNFLRADGTWASPSATGDVAYVPFTNTTNITASSSSAAQTVVTATAFSADGSAYWVEFFCPKVTPYANGRKITFTVWEGSTDLGTFGVVSNTVSGQTGSDLTWPVLLKHRFVPAAGTRTYAIKAYQDSGTGTSVVDGIGLGGYIRVFK